MPGPKPIPTELKRLAGNPGHRRLNDCEPKAPRGTPSCPKQLAGEARAEWKRITAELRGMGILAKTDRAAIALYCEHFRQWSEATADVVKNGTIVKQPNGWHGPNPYLSVATKASAAMTRLLAEFGLTPSARSRIHVTDQTEDDDGLDAYTPDYVPKIKIAE